VFKFRIMPDDGEPFEVVATTRDIARWEKTTKGASFAALQADMHVVDLYKIAYYACQRQGIDTGTPRTLVEFESGVDLDVLGDDEDAEPDPTRPAA
jgi:hypothetical protein